MRTRTLILDAQGLSKLASGDPAVRSLVRTAQTRDGLVVTAASTLAEVLRGGQKDAPVHQALHHVNVAPISGEIGRKAGELLGAKGMSGPDHTVDALLAMIALEQPRPAFIVTSDPHDMARLTDEPHRRKADRIAVIPV